MSAHRGSGSHRMAAEPFRFNTRMRVRQLTGLKARNIVELMSILETAPDSVVYYHTHRFLEDHYYLTPEPANDFALWVGDALANEELAERLASVDTFEFATLSALRDTLVRVIRESFPSGRTPSELCNVQPGREFHFLKSVSIIMETPYLAHDLKEFMEALRHVSSGSLNFHFFESRLRLGRGVNDFSVWLEKSLGENELGERIARVNPYAYTLEGLRSELIQMVGKWAK